MPLTSMEKAFNAMLLERAQALEAQDTKGAKALAEAKGGLDEAEDGLHETLRHNDAGDPEELAQQPSEAGDEYTDRLLEVRRCQDHLNRFQKAAEMLCFKEPEVSLDKKSVNRVLAEMSKED